MVTAAHLSSFFSSYPAAVAAITAYSVLTTAVAVAAVRIAAVAKGRKVKKYGALAKSALYFYNKHKSVPKNGLSKAADNEYQALGHELGHLAEYYAGDKMAEVKEAIIKFYIDSRDYSGLDEALEKYKKDYPGLDREGLISELTSNAVSGMLSSDEGVSEFLDWLQNESGYTVEKKKSLLKKLSDWLSKIIEAIKDFMSNGHYDSTTSLFAQERSEEIQKIRKMFLEALDEAAANYREKGAVESGVRYSINNDNSSIKQQLKEHSEELKEMEIVADIFYQRTNKKILKNMIISEFKRGGFKIDRKNFGIIEIGERQINDSLNYLNDDSECAAMFAVPKVLKRGKLISGHGDHKGRSYGTVTIAAPININGVRGNVAVVVRQTGKNRYYTHRIRMPDGGEFVFNEIKNETKLTSADMLVVSNDQGTAIGSVSNESISQPDNEVKKNFSVATLKEENKSLLKKVTSLETIVEEMKTQMRATSKQHNVSLSETQRAV